MNAAIIAAMETPAIDRAIDAIARDGYAIVPDFIDGMVAAQLRANALRLESACELAPAAVGHGDNRKTRADIRGDRIRWIDDGTEDPAERSLFAMFEELRRAGNRELQLGLFSFEAHYAVYPPRAGYARHRDRFRDDDSRVLSLVVYLNDPWRAHDGGQLRLYVDEAHSLDVDPMHRTAIVFLSERFAHQVLPANRSRVSIAAWFRRRN